MTRPAACDDTATDPPSTSAPAAGGPQPGADELMALLARVAQGQREAFATLYEKTRLRLFAVILRVQHDRALAEDVLQEVYVSVWRAAAEFDAGKARPLTWMAAIARHRAIDSLRRRQVEPTWVTGSGNLDDDEAPDALDRIASDDEGPLERLQRAAEALAMQRCVGGLSREQQMCVSMAFYQGLSHNEVAEHLGQPLGTVKSWVRRGLQSLRACLDRAVAGAGAGAGAPAGR